MKQMWLLIAAIILSSCVSAGVEVTQKQAASLEKGVTTYADVIARFGKPTTVMLRADGTKFVSYVYMHGQPKPQTFIPIVGAFAGGADVKSNSVSLMFDKDGILTDFTASETNVGAGTGIVGGAYRQPVDQPREAQ